MHNDFENTSKLFVPQWLMRLLAPKLVKELDDRSALTGTASKQVSDVSLFWGALTIQVVVVSVPDDQN